MKKKRYRYLAFAIIIAICALGFTKFALIKWTLFGFDENFTRESFKMGHVSYDDIERIFLWSNDRDTMMRCLHILGSEEFTQHKYAAIIKKLRQICPEANDENIYEYASWFGSVFDWDNGLRRQVADLAKPFVDAPAPATRALSSGMLNHDSGEFALMKKLMSDESAYVRQSAVNLLFRIPPSYHRQFAEEIKALLNDPDKDVREKMLRMQKRMVEGMAPWQTSVPPANTRIDAEAVIE